jgi:hypothetical protein
MGKQTSNVTHDDSSDDNPYNDDPYVGQTTGTPFIDPDDTSDAPYNDSEGNLKGVETQTQTEQRLSRERAEGKDDVPEEETPSVIADRERILVEKESRKRLQEQQDERNRAVENQKRAVEEQKEEAEEETAS